MGKISLMYAILTVLIVLNGWISILGSGVSYFYLIVGFLFNKEMLGKGDPAWFAILCFLVTLLLAFWQFNGAEKRIEGSYMIPQRVTVNMSAYFVGSTIGALWALIAVLV